MSAGDGGSGGADGLARMLAWVDALPDQIRRAWQAWDARGGALSPPVPAGAPAPRAVFLGGMGGSAMAGHLAAALLADRLPFPCVVHSGPEVPAWVGPGTPAILSSYSGDTWETLAMYAACRSRGAALYVVTSGGRLRTEAEAHGVPCFPVPDGYAPRAALGWLLVPLWRALALSAGAGTIEEGALLRAADVLDVEVARWRAGSGLPGREPDALARALAGRMVLVAAPSVRRFPAALRWKTQILENAEQAAFAVGFPEGGHNEIMGWGHLAALSPASGSRAPSEGAAPGAVLVFLDGDGPPEETRALLGAARAEAAARGLEAIAVPGHGQTPVERMLADVLLADRVSLELARRRGVDPLPVPAISRFKRAHEEERFA